MSNGVLLFYDGTKFAVLPAYKFLGEKQLRCLMSSDFEITNGSAHC